MGITWPKSEGPALTTQGGGSTEPESGTYEAPGQLGLPNVPAVPDGAYCRWGGGGNGLIKSSCLFLFLPRLVGGFAFLRF